MVNDPGPSRPTDWQRQKLGKMGEYDHVAWTPFSISFHQDSNIRIHPVGVFLRSFSKEEGYFKCAFASAYSNLEEDFIRPAQWVFGTYEECFENISLATETRVVNGSEIMQYNVSSFLFYCLYLRLIQEMGNL